MTEFLSINFAGDKVMDLDIEDTVIEFLVSF